MTIERSKEILEYIKSDCKNCSQEVALNMAIRSLEAVNKIKEQINSNNRGNCDYFIVDNIEEIITEV